MCQRAKKTSRKPRRTTPRPQPGDKVVPVRCQPKTYPCPRCGCRGHRRHKYNRFVRSLAYGQAIWLHVFYAEYRAPCGCCKYFRSCPPGMCERLESWWILCTLMGESRIASMKDPQKVRSPHGSAHHARAARERSPMSRRSPATPGRGPAPAGRSPAGRQPRCPGLRLH